MTFYEFKDVGESYDLKIYDYVGQYDGVNTTYIEEQLNSAELKPINIYINSYGGEVFEGFAIYNMLKRYEGYKTVYIDGIAASIASVIALAGDKVIMNKASMMMIHNASGACFGNAEDMKKVMSALEQINEVIKDVYVAKTNMDREKLAELMANETFLTANECLGYGFADEILDSKKEDSMTIEKSEITDTLESFKEAEEVGGETTVDDKSAFLNKKSHWEWLTRKGY